MRHSRRHWPHDTRPRLPAGQGTFPANGLASLPGGYDARGRIVQPRLTEFGGIEVCGDFLLKNGLIKGENEQLITEEVNKLPPELLFTKEDLDLLVAYLVQRKLNGTSKPVASTRPRQ